MISAADVDAFRRRAPTPGSQVLSVYLDVDQSRAANLNREFVAALKVRLANLERQLGESERATFREDAGRVQRFVADYEPHAKTLVVFTDQSAGLFWTGELQVPLRPDVRWQPTAYVRPLIEALDDHERYGIVLVDKQRARVFTVHLGEIEEEDEAFAGAEVRHKKASGTDHWRSDMHFQRQDDLHVHWHARRVAELIDDVARRRAFDRVAIAGPVEATSELARVLPRHLADRVFATLRLPVDAPAREVLRQTLQAAERAERAAEAAVVGQLLDHRGAVGLPATLAAFQQGRVHVLVYAEGYESGGAECARCHALFPAGGATACGYCGDRLLPLDDLLERLLERAHESAARLEKVHGEAATHLRDAGGIGAIRRF